MSSFQEYLKDKALPGWAMLCNAEISFVPGEGSRIDSFEDARWSNSFSALRDLIPSPVLLDTREARELSSYRFSEEELKSGAFSYNDKPAALTNEASDQELFGESWTIFWVVPPDKEAVIAAMLDVLEKESGGSKISAELLKQVWNNYLERIFFRLNGDEDMFEMHLLYDEIFNEVVERIQGLTNAPDEDSWAVLNEDEFMSEDE